MQKSGESGMKPIKVVEERRACKAKLEHISHEDITERKKAEQALRESEEKFRSIFDNANDIIASVTKTGKILEVNKKIEEVLGYKPDELIGKNFMTLGILTAKNAAKMAHIFKKSVKIGGFLVSRDGRNVTEVWVNHKDGHPVLLEANTSTIRKDGKLVGYLSVIRNITERKKVEEALRESEENYRMVSGLTSDYIVKVKVEPDEQMVLVSATDRLENMTGYALDELRSQGSWSKIVHPDDFDEFQNFLKRIVSSRKSCELEFRGIDRKHEFEWLHAYGQPMLDEKNDRVTSIVFAVKDITERKRNEQMLRESEERHRAIVEQAADSIVLVNAETGELLEFNDTAHENLGYTREEFQKLKIPDFEIIESAEEVTGHIERIVREGRDTFETKHKTKDGRIRDIQVSSRAISIGGRDFIQSIWRDITDRKRAETAYRSLVDHSLQGLAILQDERIVFANKTLARITGYTIEELLAMSPDEVRALIHPEDREFVWSRFRQRLHGKLPPERYEFRGIRKDGSIRWMEIHTSLVEYQGRPANQTAYIDITERKRAEEALRESESRLRGLFETMAEGMVFIAPKGQIIQANPAAERILGLQRSAIEDRNYVSSDWEILHADGTPMSPEEMAGPRAMKEKRLVKDVVMGTKRPDGSISWINVSAAPLMDETGNFMGVVGTFADITERKEAEEAYRSLVDHSLQGLVIFEDGRVIFANEAMAQITGYTGDEMKAMSAEEVRAFVHPEDREMVWSRYRQRL